MENIEKIADEWLECILNENLNDKIKINSTEKLLKFIINSKDSNRQISIFHDKVGIKIFDLNSNNMNEDLYDLLQDIGTIMFDTIEDPELANNFNSRPSQLIERLKNIKRIL